MPATVKFDLDTGAVHVLLKSQGGEVGHDIERRGRAVLSRARALAPVKTGALRNSISMSMGSEGGEVSADISASAPYALFVHEGTGPHMIYGHPFLAFQGRSGLVITRAVHHPGTRPQPFLADALDAAVD
jgi:Bacteriophage HK97-gp10, putative tail-component